MNAIEALKLASELATQAVRYEEVINVGMARIPDITSPEEKEVILLAIEGAKSKIESIETLIGQVIIESVRELANEEKLQHSDRISRLQR